MTKERRFQIDTILDGAAHAQAGVVALLGEMPGDCIADLIGAATDLRDDLDAALERAGAAEADARRLAEIVRRKQWVGTSGRMIPPVCPDCHWTAKKGHSPDCDVGAALAAHAAAGAGGGET